MAYGSIPWQAKPKKSPVPEIKRSAGREGRKNGPGMNGEKAWGGLCVKVLGANEQEVRL